MFLCCFVDIHTYFFTLSAVEILFNLINALFLPASFSLSNNWGRSQFPLGPVDNPWVLIRRVALTDLLDPLGT